MTGIPATVAVQILGGGVAAAAGTGAIGTISVAALSSARAFMRARDPDRPGPAGGRTGRAVRGRATNRASG